MPQRRSTWARPTLASGVAVLVLCLVSASLALFGVQSPLLLYGCALLLAGAITFAGYRLTAGALRPVAAIRTGPHGVEAADPHRRVPPSEAPGGTDGPARGGDRTLGRLEEALERQRRFSSDASHELRTPLTAMRAQIEDALHAPQETDVVTLARALLPSLDRLQRLATDLLALSQLESGSLPIRRQPVNLARLTEGELQMTPTAKRLVRRLDPDVVVLGDPHSLGRLISNVVGNALRHATSTVTVTVRREARGPGQAPDGTAVLEVVDDGPGIAHEQRERIFERFTRLDSARSRDAGGAGLGLPIARRIAENHGGRLTIEDSTRGACFVLRLPLAPGTSP